MVVVEILKHGFNRGRTSKLSFFRDSRGLECDLLFETACGLAAIEIKSGATVVPDFFTALDAVAKAVPDIAVKAVVYGGTERQSRSAAEIVPFDDLNGFLGRFEIDREMSAFVKDRMGPAPSTRDIDVLDGVFRGHIRPVLDALDSSLRDHVGRLFRKYSQNSNVEYGQIDLSLGSLLETRRWDRTRDDFFAKPGFSLTTARPVKISHTFHLSGYSSREDVDFGLAVSLLWSFETEACRRTATVNDTTVVEIDERIHYSDIDARSARADSVRSTILNAVMREIEKLSNVR